VWSSVAAGIVVLAAANWHLVHVAISSQPDCVAHVRIGDRDGQPGMFSAARSSCTPPTTGAGRHE
jgi:hypothetical protein